MASKRLDQICLELARRQRDEALRYFQPHGGQIEFLREIEREGAFIVISGAGNGWGKSEILAAIFAAAMWPTLAPKALALPILQAWKYPKRARIYSKPAELEEIGSLQTAIARLFPKGRYTASKGRYGYPSVFKADTGWVLDLFSYERDEAEAAGPNIGLQAFNEPMPEPLWKEAMARSRSGGLILGGMTSLFDNPWIVDGLLTKADGKDIRVRYGSSCENCKTHGTNGHLEHSHIERILAQFPEDERDARFSGKPLSMSGRIYKDFDRSVHVVKDVKVPQVCNFYQAVDPAIGKPLAVVYGFVEPDGSVTIFDEIPDIEFQGSKDDRKTVKDYANLFKAVEAQHGIKEITRIIDRHFANKRATLGSVEANTLKQDFSDQGIDFKDSYAMDEEVETGIRKVKEYLSWDRAKDISALNRPKLTIAAKCKNTIASFEKWGRNPDTRKASEEYKDFADSVRYLLMDNPRFEAPSNWPSNISKPYHGLS